MFALRVIVSKFSGPFLPSITELQLVFGLLSGSSLSKMFRV